MTEATAWCVPCQRLVAKREWRDHDLHQMLAPRPAKNTAAPISDGAPRIVRRWTTGLAGLDRCLGGGIVPGTRVLVTGSPGCGKSTLLLLAAHAMAQRGAKTVYLTGEESHEEVQMRWHGMDLRPSERVILCATTQWEQAEAVVRQHRPHLVIMDSLPRFTTTTAKGEAGDARQVEALVRATGRIVEGRRSMFVVNHVNAQGVNYGRNDTVHDLTAYLHFHVSAQGARVLTTVKNRHGPSGEASFWEFPSGSKRLREVPDAHRALLADLEGAPGVVLFPSMSAGVARAIALPLEASVSAPRGPSEPRHRAYIGLPDRMVDDVLDRLGDEGVKLADRSVRVQLCTLDDAQLDDAQLGAAVAAALVSAVERTPIGTLAVFGALTAAGRLVADARRDDRLRALLLATGVEVIYGPPGPASDRYVAVQTLAELVEHLQARCAHARVQQHAVKAP